MSGAVALTFDEAAEAFGAAPDQSEKMKDLVSGIFSLTTSADPMKTLEDCLVEVDGLQGGAYTEALGAAVDLGLPGSSFDRLREFFHLAAGFGEMRLAGRIMQNLHSIALDRQKPDPAEGDA